MPRHDMTLYQTGDANTAATLRYSACAQKSRRDARRDARASEIVADDYTRMLRL